MIVEDLEGVACTIAILPRTEDMHREICKFKCHHLNAFVKKECKKARKCIRYRIGKRVTI